VEMVVSPYLSGRSAMIFWRN